MTRLHRPRGYILFEMLAWIGIMVILMGSVTGAVITLRRALLERALREQQEEQWQAVEQYIRDDLRAARVVYWPAAGESAVKIARSDGTTVTYERQQTALVRAVMRGEKEVEQRHFQVNAGFKQLERSVSGGKVWDLAAVPPRTMLDVGRAPVFLMLTCELRLGNRAPRTVLVGAATRSE